MNAVPDQENVRERLARATGGLHAYLHGDELLSRLTTPEVTHQEVYRALQVFGAVNRAVERQRQALQLWPELSLAGLCAALQVDCGLNVLTAQMRAFEDPDQLLGGLYVAHGATFGRRVIGRSVLSALSDAPKAFLTTPAAPQTWSILVGELERRGQSATSFYSIVKGASRTFGLTATLCSEAVWRFP